MSKTMHDREFHLKRKTMNRLRTERTYRSSYGYGEAMRERWPRLKTVSSSRNLNWDTEEEAERFGQQRAGRYEVRHYYTYKRGDARLPLKPRYYVAFVERIGAPFREAVQTWETQEADRAASIASARKEVTAGQNYWYGRSTRWHRAAYIRRWRHQGRRIARMAQAGDDAWMELDPQPQRLGIAWMID